MFGTVQPTPLDLEFRLFGIPVRISAWFWAAGVFMGFPLFRDGQYPLLLAWLLVLFISILVHELGHALTARSFGHSSQILLYHFGGLAFHQPSARHPYALWQSILISLAGPMAGFALAAVVIFADIFWLNHLTVGLEPERQRLVDFVLSNLIFINTIWGAINLLPVLPLDGGQVCRDVCSTFSRYNGIWYATRISVVVAALAAIGLFFIQMTFGAILFAILCASNIQSLQARGRW